MKLLIILSLILTTHIVLGLSFGSDSRYYYRGFCEINSSNIQSSDDIINDGDYNSSFSHSHFFGLAINREYNDYPLYFYPLYNFSQKYNENNTNKVEITKHAMNLELFMIPFFLPGVSLTFDYYSISDSTFSENKNIFGYRINIIENILLPYPSPDIPMGDPARHNKKDSIICGPFFRTQAFIGSHNQMFSYGVDIKTGIFFPIKFTENENSLFEVEIGFHYEYEDIAILSNKSYGFYFTLCYFPKM